MSAHRGKGAVSDGEVVLPARVVNAHHVCDGRLAVGEVTLIVQGHPILRRVYNVPAEHNEASEDSYPR